MSNWLIESEQARRQAEHQAYKRRRGCVPKIKYGTKLSAELAIARIHPNETGLHAYLCEFCFKWHIGHKSSCGPRI